MNHDTTIQEQLRPIALGDDVGDLPGLSLDSCDRIDALEAALREIDALAEVSSNTRHALTRCRAIARTALEASS